MDNLKLWYKCSNCGNTCLSDVRPDNSICGGCNKPDWKLKIYQTAYIVNQEDWNHPDGEIY